MELINNIWSTLNTPSIVNTMISVSYTHLTYSSDCFISDANLFAVS